MKDVIIDFEVNGVKMYMDYNASKKHSQFMEYRELLLHVVRGPLNATPERIEAANKHIYENYPQYREYIIL